MKEQGLSIYGVLWMILIVLKAVGSLNWGWITVLLFPIWFPILSFFAVIFMFIACFIAFLAIIVFLGIMGALLALLGLD